MTKAERFYKRAYQERLRQNAHPSITRIMIDGRVVTPEDASKYQAETALKHYKSVNRNILICCEGMQANQKEEEGDRIGVVPDYKHPDNEPKISLSGNIITYCPFCSARIILDQYKDEEFEPSHE